MGHGRNIWPDGKRRSVKKMLYKLYKYARFPQYYYRIIV